MNYTLPKVLAIRYIHLNMQSYLLSKEEKMGHCLLLDSCIHTNDTFKEMPVTSDIIINNYCTVNNSNCSRFIIYDMIGQDHIPNDLMPDDVEQISEILSKHAKQAA